MLFSLCKCLKLPTIKTYFLKVLPKTYPLQILRILPDDIIPLRIRHVCKQNLTLLHNNQFDLHFPLIKHLYICNINQNKIRMDCWTLISKKNLISNQMSTPPESLRTGLCKSYWALVEEASTGHPGPQGPLEICPKGEHLTIGLFFAGRSLTWPWAVWEGFREHTGKASWVWHEEVIAVYLSGESGSGQESQYPAYNRKSKRVCWETEELRAW